MKKIILLIPYYGAWPHSVQLFNETCKHHLFIDFVFITDLVPFRSPSKNISFYNLSHNDLKAKIGELFNIAISDHKPYKLCDFRPAFGVIFENIIKTYQFWGHTDIDLIFGNLNKFLEPSILSNHDIICFRPDHLHGPFTLYRNTPLINNLFKRAENYLDIFKNGKYQSFDEFGNQSFHLRKEKPLDEFNNSTISIIALKAAQQKEISLYMNLHSIEKIFLNNKILFYNNNMLINYKTKEEYAFYHWVWEKRAIYFKTPKWKKIPTEYFITSTGFYKSGCFFIIISSHYLMKSIGILQWGFLKMTNYLKRRINMPVKIDTCPVPGLIQYL